MPAPRGHKVPVPGELGGASMVDRPAGQTRRATWACRSATRPAPPNLILDADGAVVGVDLEALHRNRCGQGEVGHHRRRRFCDEPGDGRRAHSALGQPRRTNTRLVAPTSWATPTTTAWVSGWASRRAAPPEHMDEIVHHRSGLSAVEVLLTGDDRQQGGTALRRRGLLPLAHIGVRAGAARQTRRS